MFDIRTSAPTEGEQPYRWGVESEKQCTWGAYYRCIEAGESPCCFYDRATRSGSYTNAKLWLENYREPWQVKGADFKPSPGDIAVFDGNYGHVAFIERVDGKQCLISDWNRVAPLTYASDTWEYGTTLKGCGQLLGYLHFPYDTVSPIDRDESRNQIRTTDDSLRIRMSPSLSGEIVGHVSLGFYNVLDQINNDGYTWYKIAEERWCANETVEYLPGGQEDFVEEIKRWANSMIAQTKSKDKKIADLSADMDKINEIARRWIV